MRNNVGFKVDAGFEEGDENGSLVDTGGGGRRTSEVKERAEGARGAQGLGQRDWREEGAAPERWAPGVGGRSAEEDVENESPS